MNNFNFNALISEVLNSPIMAGYLEDLSSSRRRTTPRAVDSILIEPCERWEANGQLLSVPFKIEMEIREDEKTDKGALTERMKRLMDYYSREFQTQARTRRISVVSKEEIQFMPDGMKCVVMFQLGCSDWQPILTQFMDNFFAAIGKQRFAPHEMPTISTHSLLLYPIRLLNIHNKLPLVHLQFGSIINNGVLGRHWILSDPDKRFPIHASFEYDNQNIVIDYANRVTIKSAYSRKIDDWGKITIDMTSIRRVIFNQRIDGDVKRISLVLLVDSSPKMQVRFDYRSELQRGRFLNEISDKETLLDSKAIVLEFDTQGIKGKLQGGTIECLYFDIISRLRHVTGRKIEFGSFAEEDMLKGEVKHRWDVVNKKYIEAVKHSVCPFDFPSNPTLSYDAFDMNVIIWINDASAKLFSINGGGKREYQVRWKAFRLRALLQGILDRGMEYRIELLRNRSTWYEFVNMAADRYAIDEKRTLHALERVICLISERRPNCSIPCLFLKEWTESTENRRSALYNDQDKTTGCWRIMKLMATPTRIIFVGYEIFMGNRVLNKYAKNENDFIRLIFRDDRGVTIWESSFVYEVVQRIQNILEEGIDYAGRHYAWLGSSNSQLRDQGCYMINVDHADSNRVSPRDIRKQMGDFHSLPNIPKMLARLGQVFTQARRSEIALSSSEFGVTFDFTGGMNTAGKPYVFSDGVGRISAAHAALLSEEHGLRETASAFQIRFRGEKGLLCVDPSIDERNTLLNKLEMSGEKKVFVRPSMSKFQVVEEDRSNLEIVKFSSTSPAFLNRPFINILCQVSQAQSVDCHKRVKGRVKYLMHQMLSECFKAHYIETKAVEAIGKMSFPFPMDINSTSGLTLTTEPFFRVLLRANTKYVIERRLSKMNIKLPTTSARTMLGVVDTTGLLQYGQVFCQYSDNMSKRSCVDQRNRIFTGPLMITKNPCISSGDVRMFEAVDIPALRHLTDVIVFPMHGPRPHPDEMAGSDLDGDEYMVIWDEDLFLERNEEASVFPIGEETDKWKIPKGYDGTVNIDQCEKKAAEFFSEAMVYGQPGELCNAHLAISDLYGLNSAPAVSLAMKAAQIVDYQKSGIRPEKMTIDERNDPKDPKNRVIPAEKSKIKPDFLRKYRQPVYESTGILGQVFREASKYEHAFEFGEQQIEKIDRDPSFLIDGWEEFVEPVRRELTAYTHLMKSVIELYGISTEEELLSGMIISMKKRLSDREEEDGTHFTTNRVIEGMVKKIIETTRETFFQLDFKKIHKKAAAAYNVAYEAANECVLKGEQCAILLSFPWLFYDVLADVKKKPRSPEGERDYYTEPLIDRLSSTIDRYSGEPANSAKFASFVRKFDREDSTLARSIRENQGLARTSFVLREWANNVGGLNERFREEHLLSLFVQFWLGDEGAICASNGAQLLSFIEYISSYEFRTRSSLSFDEIGGGVMMRGQWKSFSEATLSSFLSLVTSHRLDLPMERRSGVTAPTVALRELEPRVMELPAAMMDEDALECMEEVREALMRVSGCKDVKLRVLKNQYVVVSAVGRVEQLRVLSSYVCHRAPPRESSTLKGKIDNMARFTYDRLMKAAKAVPSLRI